MNAESPIRTRDRDVPPIGTEELAEGLMLVRASTLKVVRFQLAMERQDRRVALAAVDDLVALDRKLQNYLADVPAASDQLLFRNALDDERALLDREKLTLAAQVVRREPAVAEAPATPQEPPCWDEFAFTGPDERRPNRAIFWLALVLALLAAVAGAAWMLAGPEMLSRVGGIG